MWDDTRFEFLADGGVLIIKRWTALNLEPIEDTIRLSYEELQELIDKWRENKYLLCRKNR